MDWWTNDHRELYWCEITDREDIGADLKCPLTNERGDPHWSYELICAVWPGDIVLQYSTRVRALVEASVAGGPLEERPIVWAPHGTVGRAQSHGRMPRPGWWLPLYGYQPAESTLSLRALQNPTDEEWIRAWIEQKGNEPGVTRVAAPFQRYRSQLRANQGYLTKMPAAFVDRWSELRTMTARVADTHDSLVGLGDVSPPAAMQRFDPVTATFQPKSSTPYEAITRATVQRRSRKHEQLVTNAGEWLKSRGATVTTPHPLDLFITHPVPIIIEAELTGSRGVRAAVREALGQLHDYRYFWGPKEAALCVLLDATPEPDFEAYVENYLELFLVWWTGEGITGGSRSAKTLRQLGIDVPPAN